MRVSLLVGTAARTLLCAMEFARGRDMTPAHGPVPTAPGTPGENEGTDWVDEQSKQSFPASDAPSRDGATGRHDRAETDAE